MKIVKLFKRSFQAVFFFFHFSIFSSFFDFPLSNLFSRYLFTFYLYCESIVQLFDRKFAKLLWAAWFVFFSKKKQFAKAFRFLSKFVCQSLGHFVFLRFFLSKKLWITWTSLHWVSKKKKSEFFRLFEHWLFFVSRKNLVTYFIPFVTFQKFLNLGPRRSFFLLCWTFFSREVFWPEIFFQNFASSFTVFTFTFFCVQYFLSLFAFCRFLYCFFGAMSIHFSFFQRFLVFHFFFLQEHFCFTFWSVFWLLLSVFPVFNTWQNVHYMDIVRLDIFPSLFVAFFVCPQTDTAQLYNTQSGTLYADTWLGLNWPWVFNRVFIETSVITTSRHGCGPVSWFHRWHRGAQLVEADKLIETTDVQRIWRHGKRIRQSTALALVQSIQRCWWLLHVQHMWHSKFLVGRNRLLYVDGGFTPQRSVVQRRKRWVEHGEMEKSRRWQV